jgi:hypothetical protein
MTEYSEFFLQFHKLKDRIFLVFEYIWREMLGLINTAFFIMY